MPSDERTKYGWRGGRPPAHLHLRGLCGQIPEEAFSGPYRHDRRGPGQKGTVAPASAHIRTHMQGGETTCLLK